MNYFERIREGDTSLRSQVFEENTGLVYMVIKRFGGRGYDKEELFQIGSIGLLKAIDRFDEQSSNTFSTYAVPMIIGEIRRFIRDDGIIHVSRKIKEDARKLAELREQNEKENNKELTLAEIEKATGLSREEIILASDAYSPPASLDVALPIATEENKDELIDRLMLKQVLQSLEECDRKLIELRYLCDKTQKQTAQILGINQVKVSRREKEILKRMRSRINMI